MSSIIYSCLHYYSIGGYVVVNGLDLIEDTPIIDIKPYIPAFDSFPEGKYIDDDDDDDCDGNYDDNDVYGDGDGHHVIKMIMHRYK